MKEVKYEGKKLKICYEAKKIKKVYYEGKQVYSSGSIVTYYVDSGVSYTEEVDEGATCLSPQTFTPTKSGWTFVGWREDTTASSSILSSKVMGDNPITLYAVFRTNIVVTYYNNSTTASTTSKYRYYNNGNVANPSFALTQAALSGFTARGWSTGTTANASILYNNGAAFTRDSNITLYGMYYKTVTLSYNGNGNTSGSTAAQTGTRYYNSNGNNLNPTFTLKANGFTRTGYTFVAWAYQSATGTQYAPGADISNTSSFTMYAVWRPSNISAALIAKVSKPEVVTGFRNAWYSSIYDLTNVSSITFTYDYYYNDEAYGDQKYYYNEYTYVVGVSSNKTDYTASNSFSCGNYSYTTSMSGTRSVTIDVSGLTGNYYIGAGTRGRNAYKGGDTILDNYAEQDYYIKITSVTFA